ncbi:MAG: hypothetical protein R3C44_12815 [Chloroflexota bacterium]
MFLGLLGLGFSGIFVVWPVRRNRCRILPDGIASLALFIPFLLNLRGRQVHPFGKYSLPCWPAASSPPISSSEQRHPDQWGH